MGYVQVKALAESNIDVAGSHYNMDLDGYIIVPGDLIFLRNQLDASERSVWLLKSDGTLSRVMRAHDAGDSVLVMQGAHAAEEWRWNPYIAEWVLQGKNTNSTDVDWSDIRNTPTTINGYGIVDAVPITRRVDTTSPLAGGGALSSDITLSLGPIADGYIISLSWSKITGTPTTINGYGIIDAVPTTRTINTTAPLTGGGDLSTNRTLNINNVSASSRGVLIAITGTDTVPVSYDGNNHTWAKIEDRFISATAAIAVTKLALGGANTVLRSSGAVNSWGQISNAYISDVDWSKITNKPSTYNPQPHAGTHYPGGGDAINLSSTTNPGFVPAQGTTANRILVTNGSGTMSWTTVPWASLASHPTITTTAPLQIDGYASANLSANRTLSILAATTTALGSIQLAGDLGGTGASPNVLKIKGTSVTTPLGASLQTGVTLIATGTSSAAWDFIRDSSVASNAAIAWSKIVHPNIIGDYSLQATGASAQWIRVGTFTAPQTGQAVRIIANVHTGYNASNGQDCVIEITFKTSNGGSVDGNGFAGNSSYYTIGMNTLAAQGLVKWVANAAGVNATAFSLYMYMPAYIDGSHYSVNCNPGTTWTDAPAGGFGDPGVASSTVCIATHSFQLPQGVLKINDNSSVQALSSDCHTIQGYGNRLITQDRNAYGIYTICPRNYEQNDTYQPRKEKQWGGFSLTGPTASKNLSFSRDLFGWYAKSSNMIVGKFLLACERGSNSSTGLAAEFLVVCPVDSDGTINYCAATLGQANGAIQWGTEGPTLTTSNTDTAFALLFTNSQANSGEIINYYWEFEYGFA